MIGSLAHLSVSIEINDSPTGDDYGGYTPGWSLLSRIRCSIQARRKRTDEGGNRDEIEVTHLLYAPWNQGSPKSLREVFGRMRSTGTDSGELRIRWVDGAETRTFAIVGGYDAAEHKRLVVFELRETVGDSVYNA